MWRSSLHGADAEVDAGFAEIHRQQLRVRIGHVQDARIAEAFEIVDAGVVGGAANPRQSAAERGGTCEFDEIAAADLHVVSPPASDTGSSCPGLSQGSTFSFRGRAKDVD